MGLNFERLTISNESELADAARALSGDDVMGIGMLYAMLQAGSFGGSAQEILDETASKAAAAMRKALNESVGSGPEARSEATIFLCAMCVHAMTTVYAEASSLAFKYQVEGSPFPPLEEILARSVTPPRDDDGEVS